MHPISLFVHNLMNTLFQLNLHKCFCSKILLALCTALILLFLRWIPIPSWIPVILNTLVFPTLHLKMLLWRQIFCLSIPPTPCMMSAAVVVLLQMSHKLVKIILYSWHLVLSGTRFHKVLSHLILSYLAWYCLLWLPTCMVWSFPLLILLPLWVLFPMILFSGTIQSLMSLLISKLLFLFHVTILVKTLVYPDPTWLMC